MPEDVATPTDLAQTCPPPLVHLSWLEVDLDQSEACLVHSVKWSGGQVVRMVRLVMHVHPSKSKFILIHWMLTVNRWLGSKERNGSWTLLDYFGLMNFGQHCRALSLLICDLFGILQSTSGLPSLTSHSPKKTLLSIFPWNDKWLFTDIFST